MCMEDKESIELLVKALKDESNVMSETYTRNTEVMCETIKKLDKTKTFLTAVIVGMMLIFFLVLAITPA